MHKRIAPLLAECWSWTAELRRSGRSGRACRGAEDHRPRRRRRQALHDPCRARHAGRPRQDPVRQGAVHRLRADERRVREAEEDGAGHLCRRHRRQEAADDGAHLPRARESRAEHRRGRRGQEERVGQDRSRREDRALDQGRQARPQRQLARDRRRREGVERRSSMRSTPSSSRRAPPREGDPRC